MTTSSPGLRLPSLTIQQLEYLAATADADTWADAAAGLGVTPSALSQGITELERRLGVPLFERRGRRRVLSPLGRPVLDYARVVLAETGALDRWLQGVRAGRSGSLRVGMIDVGAVGHFSNQLQSFTADRPEIGFTLTVGPSRQLLQQLLDDQIDVAIVVRPPEQPPRTHLVELLTEPIRVYSPADTRRSPAPAEWGPWLTFPRSSHTRTLIESHVRGLGAAFDVVTESHQPEVLRAMVNLGLGWTALPELQAESGPDPLTPVRVEPLFHRALVALWREGSIGNPLVSQLVASLHPS